MKFERKPKICLKKLTSNDVCERNLHAGDMVTPGLQRCIIETHLSFSAEQFVQVIQDKDTWAMPSSLVKPVIKEGLQGRHGFFGVAGRVDIVYICKIVSFEDERKDDLHVNVLVFC